MQTANVLLLLGLLFCACSYTSADSLLRKVQQYEKRSMSVNRFEAMTNNLYGLQKRSSHISKRLFRRNNRHGQAKWVGQAKNVLTKVGGAVKKAAVAAKAFIKKFYGKAKELFTKIKEKVSKAVKRCKEVFNKFKGVKYVIFVKDSAKAVWDTMPEEVKDMIYDKVIDAAIGDLDNLEDLTDEDFNPDELGDDDDLAAMLGDDYADLAKELGMDYDEEIAEEIDDLDPKDKAMIKKGAAGKELKNVEAEVKSHNKHSCCCVNVNGEDVSAGEVSDEDLSKADVDDDDDDSIDIDLSDFDEKSLDEEEDIDLSDFDDMDFDDDMDKRSFSIAKPQCSCHNSAIARREVARGIRNKKKGKKSALPALTSTIPALAASRFLFKAGIKAEPRICKKGQTEGCLDLGRVRFGALSALLSTKVLCPLCDIVMLGLEETTSNPFMKGWIFKIKAEDTLNVFIDEAFKTYDGQTDFFDGHNNRWSIVEKGDDKFEWRFQTHL